MSEIVERPMRNKSFERNVRRDWLVAQLDTQLKDLAPHLSSLMELRHNLFDVEGSQLDPELSVGEQLYDDASYNDAFFSHDLGLRKGNSLDYHQTTENYDDQSNADRQRATAYRRAIMSAAQASGFVAPAPGTASEEIDRDLGILDSALEPIKEHVAAIVINGAAGMSNLKRARDAIRNIENGKIDTSHIIFSAGTRTVSDAEKNRISPPYRAGDTEYELARNAVEDLTGVRFTDDASDLPLAYGDNLSARLQSATVRIGDRDVRIDLIEAPYDEARTLDDRKPARRINTEETFIAALPLLENEKGAVVIQSHDTWTPWQELIGKIVFGLGQGRATYPAGPFNAERIVSIDEDDNSVMDIQKAQDVIDEIAKTYRQLVQDRIQAENYRG